MIIKKISLIILFSLILTVIPVIFYGMNYLNKIERTPVSVSKLHLGFDLPDSFRIDNYIDNWPIGIGDGETFIEFSYKEKDETYLIANMENEGAVSTEAIPKPDYFMLYNGKERNNFNGFYLTKTTLKESKLILLNTDRNNGYMYYQLN